MDCFSVLIIIFIVAVVIRNAKANARPENRPGQPGSRPAQPQNRPAQSQNRPKTQSIFTPTTQMPNQPIPNRQAPRQTTINEQLKRMAAETAQREVNTKTTEQAAAEYAKRKEEARRQQEARKAQMTREYAAAEPEDILERANANVAEDFADAAAVHLRAATPMSAQQLFESKETVDLSMSVLEEPGKSELMREIDDLIVKGYDGSLHFDHDFVSEGIEKLSEIDGMTRVQEA